MFSLTGFISVGYFQASRRRSLTYPRMRLSVRLPRQRSKSEMMRQAASRLSGLFYGWRMVAAGCGIRLLGGGFHLYGFTVFFLPITHELGLSRAATSLAFSLARAEGAIEGRLEKAPGFRVTGRGDRSQNGQETWVTVTGVV